MSVVKPEDRLRVAVKEYVQACNNVQKYLEDHCSFACGDEKMPKSKMQTPESHEEYKKLIANMKYKEKCMNDSLKAMRTIRI